MKLVLLALGASVALVGLGSTAEAAVVVKYDIQNGRATGYGGWSHSYNGTIAANGDGTVNYSGGSGTLNDGVIPSGPNNNHLFSIADNSAITVYLDGFYTLNSIDFLASVTGNLIPGNLYQASVTINGLTQVFATAGFGAMSGSSQPINDRINITGGLAGLATDRFTLSGFQAGPSYPSNFSIGELSVNGAAASAPVVAAVPEPATWAMMIGGFGMVGGAMRSARRKHKVSVSYA